MSYHAPRNQLENMRTIDPPRETSRNQLAMMFVIEALYPHGGLSQDGRYQLPIPRRAFTPDKVEMAEIRSN